MARSNNLASSLHDWESLLTAVREDAESLPSVEPHRAALEQVLQQTQAAKARQELHRAGKQQATQDLRALVVKGKEMAVRLRGAVKADIGTRNERLVHYRMVPVRRHARKDKPVELPAPPAPEAPRAAAAPDGPQE